MIIGDIFDRFYLFWQLFSYGQQLVIIIVVTIGLASVCLFYLFFKFWKDRQHKFQKKYNSLNEKHNLLYDDYERIQKKLD